MVSRPLRFTYIILGLDVGPELDQRPQSGRLADLAPTMLQLLGVTQPDEMTGTLHTHKTQGT